MIDPADDTTREVVGPTDLVALYDVDVQARLVDEELELPALVVPGELVAGRDRREAALRAQREALDGLI